MNDEAKVAHARTLRSIQVFDNTWAGWASEARWLLGNLAGRVEDLAAENERLRRLIGSPVGVAEGVIAAGADAAAPSATRAGDPDAPHPIASPTVP